MVDPTDITTGARWRKIGEVAALLGEPVYVIRYWEESFHIRAKRSSTRQRYYTPAQVEEFRTIQRLLRVDGYTHKGAKAQLRKVRRAADSQRPPKPTEAA